MEFFITTTRFFNENSLFTVSLNIVLQLTLWWLTAIVHPEIIEKQKKIPGDNMYRNIVLTYGIMTLIGLWVPAIVGWYSVFTLWCIATFANEYYTKIRKVNH